MKNSILGFILGVFAVISIAAGTSSTELLTIKPAKPVSVIAVSCYCDNAEKYTRQYVAKGYIFKSYSGVNSGFGLLVLEKY